MRWDQRVPPISGGEVMGQEGFRQPFPMGQPTIMGGPNYDTPGDDHTLENFGASVSRRNIPLSQTMSKEQLQTAVMDKGLALTMSDRARTQRTETETCCVLPFANYTLYHNRTDPHYSTAELVESAFRLSGIIHKRAVATVKQSRRMWQAVVTESGKEGAHNLWPSLTDEKLPVQQGDHLFIIYRQHYEAKPTYSFDSDIRARLQQQDSFEFAEDDEAVREKEMRRLALGAGLPTGAVVDSVYPERANSGEHYWAIETIASRHRTLAIGDYIDYTEKNYHTPIIRRVGIVNTIGRASEHRDRHLSDVIHPRSNGSWVKHLDALGEVEISVSAKHW